MDAQRETGTDHGSNAVREERESVWWGEKYQIWGSAQDKFVHGLSGRKRNAGGHSGHGVAQVSTTLLA